MRFTAQNASAFTWCAKSLMAMMMLQNSDQTLMSHTDSDAHGTRVVNPGQCHSGSRTLPEYIFQGTSPNRGRWDKACADARWSATKQWWLVCGHSEHKRIMHLLHNLLLTLGAHAQRGLR